MKNLLNIEKSFFKIFFIVVSLSIFSKKADASILALPACIENSVCAFVQANSRGVTTSQYCQCSNNKTCPSTFDPYDGQTVMQGVQDQYKFCGTAPVLDVCNDEMSVAYTSIRYFRREAADPIMRTKVNLTPLAVYDEMICRCPEGNNYLEPKYKFFRDPNEPLTEIVATYYFCAKLPTCSESDFCKDVTDLPGQFLVNQKCNCPYPLACPTLADKMVKINRYGQAKVKRVRCQPVNLELEDETNFFSAFQDLKSDPTPESEEMNDGDLSSAIYSMEKKSGHRKKFWP